MKWNEQYSREQEPTLDAIANYIQNPLWQSLRSFLEESYGVLPSVEYSRCAGVECKIQEGKPCAVYPVSSFGIFYLHG